ncbi:MAG: hypothetical protein AABX03_02475 [Nanoarchaeota archaeon]
MKNYNIEFSHIYADEKFGVEQINGIKYLKKIIKELNREKKSFSTVILIDEFSPDKKTLDEKDFLNKVKEYDVPVDFVGYESKLAPLFDILLKDIERSRLHFKEDSIFLIDGKNKIALQREGKPTCSALIAIWILCRFGIIKLPSDLVKNINKTGFYAEKLITILPKKYRETEDKVLKILKHSKHKEVVNLIEYGFFK